MSLGPSQLSGTRHKWKILKRKITISERISPRNDAAAASRSQANHPNVTSDNFNANKACLCHFSFSGTKLFVSLRLGLTRKNDAFKMIAVVLVLGVDGPFSRRLSLITLSCLTSSFFSLHVHIIFWVKYHKQQCVTLKVDSANAQHWLIAKFIEVELRSFLFVWFYLIWPFEFSVIFMNSLCLSLHLGPLVNTSVQSDSQ